VAIHIQPRGLWFPDTVTLPVDHRPRRLRRELGTRRHFVADLASSYFPSTQTPRASWGESMPTLDDRLLPVFMRQHWLVTLHDVREAGGERQAAAHRLSTGRWVRIERGVYRPVDVPVTWHSRLLAPILAAGPGAAASHFAAAALHGTPGIGHGRPELSIPRGREHRRSGIRVHTSTDLERCRILTIEQIPVTDIDRTLLDLARNLGHERLLRAIEWARREGRTDWSQLIASHARHARSGRPGVRRLREVILANCDRAEITDSEFELLVLSMIREHALPEPVLHHRVFDGDRFVAEVDLSYPWLKIAVELDGAVHLDADVRERDLPRQNDLVLLGWTVLRFSWKRVRERPDLVIAEIRAAIAAAN
jgi:very-short-patch-repair endonuclease/predicted transcriptional regulator of viral defense system